MANRLLAIFTLVMCDEDEGELEECVFRRKILPKVTKTVLKPAGSDKQ